RFLDLKISYTPDHFLSSQIKNGTTPLIKAAFKGNLDFIRQHLGSRYHPSIDKIDHRGFTALPGTPPVPCRKIASVIKEIQKFQAAQFVHAPVDWMQNFIGRIGEVDAVFNVAAGVVMEQNLGLALGNEDGLYTQSLVVEPREEEDDDEIDGAE
ncbi:hypothetical protein HDU80_001137, partial [Chytriomyces hyalinus]